MYSVLEIMNEYIYDFNFYNISVLHQLWENEISFSYDNKFRPCHGICFILSGSITYKSLNNKICASAGDVVVLKKDARYKAFFEKNKTHDILINFNCCTFNDDASFFDNYKEDIIVLKNRNDLEEYFRKILNYYTQPERYYMVKSVLFRIFDEITSIKSENLYLAQIKALIDNDIEFDLNEKALTEKLSISRSTFQRNFKKVYGKTFSEYRNELRIQKAKELLITENYSIEEIAVRLGYCDSSYFSKAFKQAVGVSPKKFIKQYYIM